MGRKRNETILDGVFAILKISPVWLGPALAMLVFVSIHWVAPAILSKDSKGTHEYSIIRAMCPMLSWTFAGMIIFVWIVAEANKFGNRKLHDDHAENANTTGITWQEFERLVCEAYHRKGYTAEHIGGVAGDGGIDVRLTRGSETILLQCKHWKVYKVGVAPVRELLGVVASEGANKGILVTSGNYTQEAIRFAGENPKIELLDGPGLDALIKDDSSDRIEKRTLQPLYGSKRDESPFAPVCPTCGTKMVLRTARKGANAGSQFWGCPQFPGCRGIRNI